MQDTIKNIQHVEQPIYACLQMSTVVGTFLKWSYMHDVCVCLSTPDAVGGVQNIQVHVSSVLSVSVRFYADQDRRIVSSWQFVPVYSQEIASSFTAMRTVREYAP